MSFIAVELKVIERDVPRVSRMSGFHEDRLLSGLVRLWHLCWADRRDLVSAEDLASIFGSDEIERLIDALCLAFLEPAEDALFRVRGASKYLRIRLRQSEGAMKTNARRWPKKSATPAGLESDHVGESINHRADVATPTTECQSTDTAPTTERQNTDRSTVALATVEGRSSVGGVIKRIALTPNTCALADSVDPHQEQLAPPKGSPPLAGVLDFSPLPAPKDPRLKELQKALEAAFEEATGARYKFGGAKDMQALKRILGHGATVEEAVSRFRRGLSGKKWLETKTIAALDMKWNDLMPFSVNAAHNTTGPVRAILDDVF